MPPGEGASRTAAEFWDEHHKLEVPRDYWTCHPIINEYVNSIIAPNSGSILEWFAKTFSEEIPFERGVSIGCGTGAADRQAIQAGICRHIDGFDISPASIGAAAQEAAKAGLDSVVQYEVADVNSLSLPEGRYDFALCVGSLHHVEKIEHLFNELRTKLKPGSYLFINEYVGPVRLQWTRKQLGILNLIWEIMPPEFRKPGPLSPVDEEELRRVDPSEAVRSEEIIPLLYKHFRIVNHTEYGGSFLMPFWSQGVVPEQFLDNPGVERQVIAKLLCVIDTLLLEERILPSCYAQIVARNEDPGADPQPVEALYGDDRKRWTTLWLPTALEGATTQIRHDYMEPVGVRDRGLVMKALYVLKDGGPLELVKAVLRYARKALSRVEERQVP